MTNFTSLKITRIMSGIKQIDLALKLGISPSQLSKIENGYVKCTDELYNNIIQILSDQKTERR